jgi:hypothetical protein
MQSKLPSHMQGTHQTVTVEQVTTKGIKVPGGGAEANGLGVAGVGVGIVSTAVAAHNNPQMSGMEMLYRMGGVYELGVAFGFLPPPPPHY